MSNEKGRNSWKNLSSENDDGNNNNNNNNSNSVGNNKAFLKMKNMNAAAKIKLQNQVTKISKHKSVLNFCGALTLRQQLAFGVCFSLWIAFNLYQFIIMMQHIFNRDTNKKVVTTQVPLQDVKDLPTVGFMVCAASVEALAAVGTLGRITLKATLNDLQQRVQCKNFTSANKFNDYNNANRVECCGSEIPKSIYELPKHIKSMKENVAQYKLNIKAWDAVYAGIFVSELKSGQTALDVMDPAKDFQVDGTARFSVEQQCAVNETTTDVIDNQAEQFIALDFTKTTNEQGILPEFGVVKKNTVRVALTTIATKSTTVIHKDLKCRFGNIASPLSVDWKVSFLAAFQRETITLNTEKNIITLQGGMGSFFGIFNASMLLWTVLFPMVSKKDPAVRRVHQCFGKYCCKSWRWDDENNEEEEGEEGEDGQKNVSPVNLKSIELQ